MASSLRDVRLYNFTATACVLMCLSGCTVTTFRSFDGSEELRRICVLDNSEKKLEELSVIVTERIRVHGITAEIVSSDSGCVHTLEYTGVWGGKRYDYLDVADFALRENQKTLGKVRYRDRGGPPEKRSASLSSNIDPIIDELLGIEIVEE